MNEFVKPIIVISKCLGFDTCRYDGQMLPNDIVSRLAPLVTFITVCPELEVGLGVPRAPIHLVLEHKGIRLIQPTSALDITEEMNRFALSFLASLPEVDGFILKSSSPSCGLKNIKVFSSAEKTEVVAKRAGIFAAAVIEAFPDAALIEESDLQNFDSRDYFLTKLYASAALRDVKSSGEIKRLIDFHSKNTFLILAYSPKQLKILDRLVANKRGEKFDAVLRDYVEHLSAAFAAQTVPDRNVNVMRHAFARLANKMSAPQRLEFSSMLEQYQRGQATLRLCRKRLRDWAICFEEVSLSQQTFFEPFPEELT